MLTTWLTADDADAPKGADPAYAAVMERVPLEPNVVTHVATPELRVWLPPLHVMVVPPSRNATEPVAVPEAALTVAVNVTGWPTTDGVADDVNETDVATVARTVTGLLVALVAVHPERMATTV
ncbi:hypothetical protein GCM10009721_06300 [Terrabacter tumescens]|uniref:Uncharacterized protein n=1 Tax=Terrabacter tumescens TaxID=60443 RepID=A0ABQ2HK73_9MICO|nr:hypothetical protein GCM10009721_06300 [Terrabacter tumescens]